MVLKWTVPLIILTLTLSLFIQEVKSSLKNALFPNKGRTGVALPTLQEGETGCAIQNFNDLSPIKEMINGKSGKKLDAIIDYTVNLINKNQVSAEDICWGGGGPFECKINLDDNKTHTCQCATSGSLANLKLVKNNDRCQSDLNGLCMAGVGGSECKSPYVCDSSRPDLNRFDEEFTGTCTTPGDAADNSIGVPPSPNHAVKEIPLGYIYIASAIAIRIRNL